MFFSFFPGNQWVMSIRIWSRIVDQRPPGARRSRPPSQKPCWVPCSLLPDNPFCPGPESLLHKVPLKVISTHLKLQQAHSAQENHYTHTQTAAPNSQLGGDEVREAAKSPHPLPSFPISLQVSQGLLLPAVPEPPSPTPSFGPLSMTWEFNKCLVIHLDANASCILCFIHSANIYWAYTML